MEPRKLPFVENILNVLSCPAPCLSASCSRGYTIKPPTSMESKAVPISPYLSIAQDRYSIRIKPSYEILRFFCCNFRVLSGNTTVEIWAFEVLLTLVQVFYIMLSNWHGPSNGLIPSNIAFKIFRPTFTKWCENKGQSQPKWRWYGHV